MWSKLKIFDLEVLYILKTIKIKTVLTSMQSVCVTRPSRYHLRAYRAHLGPLGGALHTFWSFEANMRQQEYAMICFRSLFCFVYILVPKIAQIWFCIQNLRMDLNFQEKKDLKIRYLVAEILSKNRGFFWGGTPCFKKGCTQKL